MIVENAPKTLKIRFLVKSIEENRCFSKKICYLFKVMHIYLALDLGFIKFKSSKAKIVMKTFSVFQCTFVCFIGIFSAYSMKNPFIYVWYICYIIEFFLYVMTLNFSKCKKTFHDLQNDLMAIDSELGVDSRCYNLEFKIILAISTAVFVRFFYSFLFCYITNSDCMLLALTILLFIPPYLSNDIMMVIYTLTFYSLSCRMKEFTKSVRKNNSDIVSYEFIYKSMIESTEEAMKMFEVIYTVCLLCNTPQALMTIYFVIALIRNNDIGGISDISYTTSAGLSIFQATVLIFLPSYFAGRLVANTENLKLVLHNILLREKDAARNRDLKRFIRYVEVRPFSFSICKIISVDWTLPVLLLNMGVTYLIVAIQFTHLY